MRGTPDLAVWSGGLAAEMRAPLWSTSAGTSVQDAEAFDVWVGADSTATLSASFTVVP